LHTEHGVIEASLRRADIEVVLENFVVVRGSRYGDSINEPYDVHELIDASRDQLEQESEAGGELELSIKRGIFGRATALFKRRKRRSRKAETDRIAKVSVHQYRIVARNQNRWTVSETRVPYILSGRYLGALQGDGRNESTPLCLLSLRKAPALARVLVYAHPDDLHFTLRGRTAASPVPRNKEVLAGIVAARTLSRRSLDRTGIRPLHGSGKLVLCCSELICEVSDYE
jgi:hypothetical protein